MSDSENVTPAVDPVEEGGTYEGVSLFEANRVAMAQATVHSTQANRLKSRMNRALDDALGSPINAAVRKKGIL